jgi:ApaG protein
LPPKCPKDWRAGRRGFAAGGRVGGEAISKPGRAKSGDSRGVSTSEAVTHGVRVQVDCRFSPERSDPSRREYFFVYTVTITNEGPEPVQLVSRHWIITNAHGKVDEVRGPGVVGQQPRLAHDETFEYTSGCPLDTAFGSMRGSYELVRVDARERFDVEIAPFALRQDGVFH